MRTYRLNSIRGDGTTVFARQTYFSDGVAPIFLFNYTQTAYGPFTVHARRVPHDRDAIYYIIRVNGREGGVLNQTDCWPYNVMSDKYICTIFSFNSIPIRTRGLNHRYRWSRPHTAVIVHALPSVYVCAYRMGGIEGRAHCYSRYTHTNRRRARVTVECIKNVYTHKYEVFGHQLRT